MGQRHYPWFLPLPSSFPLYRLASRAAGQNLALLESRIVMSLLLLRFKFTPRDDRVGEKDPSVVPTCPKNGMYLRVD